MPFSLGREPEPEAVGPVSPPSGLRPLHAGVPVQEAPGRGQAGSSSQGGRGCATRQVELLRKLVLGRQNQRQLVHGATARICEHRESVAARKVLILQALGGAFH